MAVMGLSLAVMVEDRSQVSEARRAAVSLAERAGLDERSRSDVGIVATEAATNLIKHAKGGEVLVGVLEGPRGLGLELVCVDKGPGMRDVEACLADGYSSGGTLGGGLGAMRRLADDFSVWSSVGAGTALVCRFYPRAVPAANGVRPMIAGLAVPIRGESACGDAWTSVERPEGPALLVADGLGHGPAAADAAGTAVRLFRESIWTHPEQVLNSLHAGMRSTRGAAVAVALIDRARRELRFAGVGNISGVLVAGDKTRSLVSHSGTLGHQMRKAQEFVYPWESGTLLVLHSDGLATHWKLDRYPGLFRQDPALVGAVLYRDHARGRDDASVVVCRLSAEEAAA
ncbi:ATP-binding protein [soil metagenome]